MAWVIPVILFIVFLVGIIAARTLKGKAFWGVAVFLLVWFYVPVFGFTLKSLLGM